MTARTKGDLCGLTVRDEATYGVIDTSGTSAYAGTTLTLSSPDDYTMEEIQQCGSRVRGGVFRTAASFGYDATFNYVRNQGWEDWIRRAIGSLSGVQRETPSFDTVIRVAPDEYHLWTGCRVNTLSIAAPSIGAPLEFSVSAMARWHTMTPFTDSDGDSLSIALVAIPAGAPITFNRPWEYSTNGTSWTRIKGKSFTLSINQNLSGDPGASSETDDDAFQLEAGSGSVPLESSITLDITITSVGPEWDRMRLACTTGLYFRTVIDGHTVTLSGCNLSPTMPDRIQAMYDETISVTATDMTVV